jgi:predicted lipoprotein with Yx(FWY)xxD motif
MTRNRYTTFMARAAIVPLAAVALVGTGLGITNAGAATKHTQTKQSSATVDIAKTSLGKVLVTSGGRTLYLFGADKGTTSACTGACATNWPPLRVTGKPTAGKGAKAALVSTTTRTDGGPQVTYKGHPVYTFVGDKKAGQTNGEGLNAFGGKWSALSGSGKLVSAPPPASSGGSSSSGGGY